MGIVMVVSTQVGEWRDTHDLGILHTIQHIFEQGPIAAFFIVKALVIIPILGPFLEIHFLLPRHSNCFVILHDLRLGILSVLLTPEACRVRNDIFKVHDLGQLCRESLAMRHGIVGSVQDLLKFDLRHALGVRVEKA